MRVLPYGDRAVLVELADPDGTDPAVASARVVAWVDAAAAAWPDVPVELVPAATTVLVALPPGAPQDLTWLRAAVAGVRPGPPGPPARGDSAPRTVEVPVTYDGADLAAVARLTGLDEAGVVAAHTGTPWRVAFGGFAPGFAYLVGGDPRLGAVPRRTEPRTRVPAGSVALAGGFSGVYPRASPGGWQLLGRTELAMWDLDRDPAALLAAGVPVRFVDVGGAA
ncbi:5-oxoprolinase subunit B family protein [Nocardioides zeae]|uniref:KipI family sensor histidine kinase inhibitor n=1 Tax=Nocardioides zeae TaxID=1457234 RepID=A0AAJ1X1F5_9ACTN|nr:allophanate hydrolase subunit 1 [Nocardioides zeae]MDQ1103359.1 KipI family sensor histidine kinase inhibitor [Nocardioides zeae]